MNIPENFDRWMFDYMEGNLSGNEMEAFENFLIQNPEFEIDADAWNNSVITDENLAYPNQAALEKDNRIGAVYGWGAAAMLILLLGVGSLFVFDNNSDAISGFSTDNGEFIHDNVHLQSPNHSPVRIDNSDVVYSESNETNASNHLSGNGTNNSNLSVRPDNNNGSNFAVANQGVNGTSNPSNGTQNGTNSSEENYLAYNSGTVNTKSLDQEKAKFNTSGDHKAKYQSNPESGSLNFDISKKKSNIKYNSLGRKFKRVYKKIERALNSPIGITNLRDPDLGIPQNNILSFNPGYAGGMLTPRFEMNYRNQWLGTGMNVHKATMSFDFYSREMRGGIGVIINASDYGLGGYGDYNASLIYSPKFVISQNVVFEPAVKLTLGAMNANGPKLTPNSAIEMNRGRLLSTVDGSHMTGQNQLWYKDYGLGFMLNTEWFYLGFSADNLGNHFENVYGKEIGNSPTKTPVNMTAIAGFDYESHDSRTSKKINRSISPYAMFQQFGSTPDLWGGVNIRWDWFTVGGSYSTKNEYTGTVGLHFERFKMFYRYDMTNSVFLDDKIGSHNIGIRINAKPKNFRRH